MTARRLAFAGLFTVLIFDVWWRGHTVSGSIRDAIGVSPYPVVAESEPLDCDESIYAYIGKRIASGDAMYRDLTENKPPLGYWLYALAVGLGDARELTIRLMPMPMCLATIACAWWIALVVAGPLAAVVAASITAVMSTDPYVYGNGANLEHAINLFATAGLAAFLKAQANGRRRWLVASGLLAASACLVKQVAALPFATLALALMVGRKSRPRRERAGDLAAYLGGAAAILAGTVAILALRGSLGAAYEDIVRYGSALATETPPDPKEYPALLRWFVGNTDPEGRLPWPFGTTLGRAWWAAGAWPLWAASLPALVAAALSRGPHRRLVAAWTGASWLAVAAPRLFWQHYYLLAVPGTAVVLAIFAADLAAVASRRRSIAAMVALLLFTACAAGTFAIQVRDYLLKPPDFLTARYKGGAQWVALREVGRELRDRTKGWEAPRLWVWGIQSPLYFYSGMDSVTPQVFADPLIVAYSGSGHPRIDGRIARTMRDLDATRPDLIFVGERPFPALSAFLKAHYVASPLRTVPAPIWVRRDRLGRFEAAPARR